MNERESHSAEKSGSSAKESSQQLKQIAEQKQASEQQKKPEKVVDQASAIEQAREALRDHEKAAEKAEKKTEVAEKPETPEKPAEKQDEKKTERTQETKPEPTSSKRVRKQAYAHTMDQVRSQLNPSQRIFSRLIHARPVEVTSEILEETIFRPSFLIGGALGALVLGGTVYIVARVVGFELSGSEFTIGLLVGGVVGFLLERVVGLFRRKDR